MRNIVIQNASYCFALPDGGWGALQASSINTSEGAIPLPGEAVLGLVGTRHNGRLLLAGQGHLSGSAWFWDGVGWVVVGTTFGVSPCAFGPDALFIAHGGNYYIRMDLTSGQTIGYTQQIGSQGIRYIDGETVITGDATYREGELFEWTRRGDVVCGQGHEGGAILNDHILSPGDRRFIRFARAGNDLAIGLVDLPQQHAILHWLTVADIASLPPLVPAPMPIPLPPPLPIPPKPVPPKPPAPPKPTPPPAPKFPRAAALSGGHMQVYLKLAGKYIGVDPSKSGTVYHDRTAGGGWEAVSLEPRGDGTFIATFSAAQKVLSIQPDGSLQTRPAGTDGGYEQVRATTQPEGLNLLYRADGGRVLSLLTIEDAA